MGLITPPHPPAPPTQRVVLLASDDEALHRCIAAGLQRHERIVRVGVRDGRRPSIPIAAIVLDLRERQVESAAEHLAAFRLGGGATCAHCVAIIQSASQVVNVVGRGGAAGLDVVLPDSDHIGPLVCAILHDRTNSAGGAIALAAVERAFRDQPETLRIARAVLSSGCQIHKVRQIERRFMMCRERIGVALADEGGQYPKDAIRLARSLYAVAILRLTALPLGTVATHTHFSASRWLQAMLRAELRVTAEEVRASCLNDPIDTSLDALISDWMLRRQLS